MNEITKKELNEAARVIKKANDSINSALYAILDLQKIQEKFEEEDLDKLREMLTMVYEKEEMDLDTALMTTSGFYGAEFQQYDMIIDKIKKQIP